jgi:hypothetical protein
VEQRADDVLLVLTAAVREGRRLQRVPETVDREAAVVTVEKLQVSEDAVGQPAGELDEVDAEVPMSIRRPSVRLSVEQQRRTLCSTCC